MANLYFKELKGKQRIPLVKVFGVGLAVHILVLWASFDIYFRSPLLPGLKQFNTTSHPPAKRVVLIISDGLRLDSLFVTTEHLIAPHLSKIKYTRGSWGVSTTIVPSESRPGHVALLAGIHEDPSAIARGWKENPVDFDSVVNQSTYTFGWGSPDIMMLFNKENHHHVHLNSYPAEFEDFAKNASELDKWVLNRFYEEFTSRKTRDCNEMCSDGVLFFLHLLATDTVGHAFKPYSVELIRTVQYVDYVVREVEEIVDSFFKDNATAYVFTADHGMTDWGSHGSGSEHETKVPFIAWGAGIANSRKQIDLQQADVAPLLSALLGLNIPVHSVGKLPKSILDVDGAVLADMVFANTKQQAELYRVREKQMAKKMFNFLYFPFTPFKYAKLDHALKEIHNKIQQSEFDDAIEDCYALMELLDKGRFYLQTYFQTVNLIVVSLGFILWMIYLMIAVVNLKVKEEIYEIIHRSQTRTGFDQYCFGSLIMIITGLIYAQSLPLSFYIYYTFPVWLLWLIFSEKQQITYTITLLSQFGYSKMFVYVLVLCVAVIFMVLGFEDTRYFIAIFVGVGIWGWMQDDLDSGSRKEWLITCSFNAFFLMLTPMKAFNAYLFVGGIGLWKFVQYRIVKNTLLLQDWNSLYDFKIKVTYSLHFIVVFLADLVALTIRLELTTNEWIIFACRVFSWSVLGVLFVLPIFSGENMVNRLYSIVMAVYAFYVLVAVNSDLSFLAIYIYLLYQWMKFEDIVANKTITFPLRPFTYVNSRPSVVNKREDVRRAFFFLFFTLVGFFGTGNIASISSFDPMWVKPFVTVFSPFTMTALIILKIIIPFMCTSCAFRAIHVLTNSKPITLFSIVLIYCDFMVIMFLNRITNEGSWLQIGESLSRFIICDVMVIMLIILYGLAYMFTTYNVRWPKIGFK